jgi:hypothetical protein
MIKNTFVAEVVPLVSSKYISVELFVQITPAACPDMQRVLAFAEHKLK